MDLFDSDAVRATDAAAKLRGVVRRLEGLPSGPERVLARSATQAVADLLSECLTPPPAAATDALLEVIILGVKQMLASAK